MDKEALEQFLWKTYSNPQCNIPQTIQVLVQPVTPEKIFNDKSLTGESQNEIIPWVKSDTITTG